MNVNCIAFRICICILYCLLHLHFALLTCTCTCTCVNIQMSSVLLRLPFIIRIALLSFTSSYRNSLNDWECTCTLTRAIRVSVLLAPKQSLAWSTKTARSFTCSNRPASTGATALAAPAAAKPSPKSKWKNSTFRNCPAATVSVKWPESCTPATLRRRTAKTLKLS